MNHLQLAIASIVDANTGNGLPHGGVDDYREQERRAHRIRSRSVHAVIDSIAGSLRGAIANYREQARRRRALAQLSSLSDYYLDDIGLTRGDIAAVKLGQHTLEALNAQRRARLAVAPLDEVAAQRVDSATRTTATANEDDYAGAKCA